MRPGVYQVPNAIYNYLHTGIAEILNVDGEPAVAAVLELPRLDFWQNAALMVGTRVRDTRPPGLERYVELDLVYVYSAGEAHDDEIVARKNLEAIVDYLYQSTTFLMVDAVCVVDRVKGTEEMGRPEYTEAVITIRILK